MKTRKATGKQEVLKKGSLSATLYHTTKRVAGRDYEIFRLVYVQPGGGRKVRDFGSRDKAQEVFSEVASAYALGRPSALSFTPAEQQAHDAAVKVLEPTGLGLYEAAVQFASAVRTLPPGVTLAEAVGDFTRRHPAGGMQRSVSEVVDELLADKRENGKSDVHLRDLVSRLGRFARDMQCPIASVTADLVRGFLRELRNDNGEPLGPRTRRNYLRTLSALFNYAGRRRYISSDLVADIRAIEAPTLPVSEAGVFTSKDMASILSVATDDLIPSLALGAFAGLRTAEIQRMDWGDIRLAERVIVVAASKAKTASRRVIPISDNLLEWLAPLAKPSGKVSPATEAKTLSTMFSRASDRAGIQWVGNGLRHAFCSYRLAVTHDPARVATEAGNSPNMIHRCYKALTTEAEGLAWFAIRPGTESNVVSFTAATA